MSDEVWRDLDRRVMSLERDSILAAERHSQNLTRFSSLETIVKQTDEKLDRLLERSTFSAGGWNVITQALKIIFALLLAGLSGSIFVELAKFLFTGHFS